jgi:hypothetical protein
MKTRSLNVQPRLLAGGLFDLARTQIQFAFNNTNVGLMAISC